MITIFKKLSTVMTTYSDGYITGRPVPPLVTISCLLIVRTCMCLPSLSMK